MDRFEKFIYYRNTGYNFCRYKFQNRYYEVDYSSKQATSTCPLVWEASDESMHNPTKLGYLPIESVIKMFSKLAVTQYRRFMEV
ncbi:MAG: hypothetical protein ACHQ1D_01585 [Nitrososphaerales archaeon]